MTCACSFYLCSESLRQDVPQREPTNHVTEDGTEELQPEQLIVPGTPIQFDIVLPATEFQDQNRGNRYKLSLSQLCTFLYLTF